MVGEEKNGFSDDGFDGAFFQLLRLFGLLNLDDIGGPTGILKVGPMWTGMGLGLTRDLGGGMCHFLW